jgi:hypothetical protein
MSTTFEFDEKLAISAAASSGRGGVMHISAAWAADLLGIPKETFDVSEQIHVAAIEPLEKELRERGVETKPNWPEIRRLETQDGRFAANAVATPVVSATEGTSESADAPPNIEDDVPKFSTWLTRHYHLDGMMGENLRGALDLFRMMHPNGTIE